MSFWRKSLVVGSAAALLLCGSVMAQDAAAQAAAAEEESAVAEEIPAVEEAPPAAEEVLAQPEPEPEAVAAAPEPAPEPPKADKPKPVLEVTPYGTASYRFRGRLWSAAIDTGSGSNKKTVSGSSMDYLNLIGWLVGLKAKVDDQLSLQFQIGNDLNAGESVSWSNNNMPSARLNGMTRNGGNEFYNNLYVHLASATWNPGPVNLSGGIIAVSSNGTLDLLERSLSTGSYGDAIFQTWSSQSNNSLMAIKLGVPIIKEGIKLGVELTSSVINPRTQSLISNSGTTGKWDSDTGVTAKPDALPSAVLFIADVPFAAGDVKITPELTYVLNRNYNRNIEKGDDEMIFGLSGGYKVNKELSLSLHGAYGMVSNENSKVGSYGGSGTLSGNGDRGDNANNWTGRVSSDSAANIEAYKSNGLIFGVGCSYKVGPGSASLDLKYGNAFDGGSAKYQVAGEEIDAKTATNKDDILVDLRYSWNVHPKFSIQPRWRTYVTLYNEKSKHLSQKMENRPELILTGSF